MKWSHVFVAAAASGLIVSLVGLSQTDTTGFCEGFNCDLWTNRGWPWWWYTDMSDTQYDRWNSQIEGSVYDWRPVNLWFFAANWGMWFVVIGVPLSLIRLAAGALSRSRHEIDDSDEPAASL